MATKPNESNGVASRPALQQTPYFTRANSLDIPKPDCQHHYNISSQYFIVVVDRGQGLRIQPCFFIIIILYHSIMI